ncbi:MAG: relaxase domain-containing protein, partial [Acidimicrobiia bacterium]
MRFTVTALGSAGGRTVGQVVADLVRYLEPRPPAVAGPTVGAPPVPGGEGPASYYADRGSEPGRWLGYSAGEAGLVGAVDTKDFARVLAGRDPGTGERLLTATGSAGRRPTLGAGQATRIGADGEPLYDTADVAAALRITRREAEALLDAGDRRWRDAAAGTTRVPEPEGSYLVSELDEHDTRWVTATELDRCEDARALGADPKAVAAAGESGDQLSLVEAARLAGVTAQYLRGLCRRWEQHRESITAALAEGKDPERAWVVAHRGTKGQWIVTRANLVAFLERRVAPAVRVGYDVTLTTEKSLGVLAGLGTDEVRRAVLDAIQAGNDAGLAYLEYHAAAGRSRGKEVLARGLTIASFRHLTSRALDPFPHHHNVVANAIVDEHGTRRALDARGLYTHAQAASALATAR